jgi:hypothetical protein
MARAQCPNFWLPYKNEINRRAELGWAVLNSASHNTHTDRHYTHLPKKKKKKKKRKRKKKKKDSDSEN